MILDDSNKQLCEKIVVSEMQVKIVVEERLQQKLHSTNTNQE